MPSGWTEKRPSLPSGRGLLNMSEGVVPLHAVRGDGWRVQLSGLPVVEPVPSWLFAELGGRYGRRRAS